MSVRLTASRVLAVVAVAVGGTVMLSPAAEAATAGTCTVKITVVGQDYEGYGYTHSSTTCNNAKSVVLETRLYSWLPATGYALDGNHARQVLNLGTVNGTRTGSATAPQEFACKMRAVADVSYAKGGIRYSKQAIKDYNC